jgi:3-deoxy-manno-octulosonate cytidylyltransferase (CMP-KDO synthetase)
MMKKFIGIIPARFASTRFPGKPLTSIKGKTMIQRVYERANSVLDDVLVATDDERILETVHGFGGEVTMTSSNHRSGTDRCYEALRKYETDKHDEFDIVINIQGDEPFIRPDQIQKLMDCFSEGPVDIATLIKPITDSETIFNANKPKVVINHAMEALYFSRSPIPYIRDSREGEWLNNHTFFQHIGLYAYRSHVLGQITKMLPGKLEVAESLEQLRWLENGLKIKTAVTEYESYGIDTPQDLEKVLSMGLFD